MIKKSPLILLLSVILVISFSISSCNSKPSESSESSRLTMGEVKRTIEKGKTNQADILSIFGSPNLVSKNRQNNEVWAYNRMSYDTSSSQTSGGFIFIGGSKASTSATTSSMDLIITFDSNDIVTDYSIVQASY